MPLYCLNENAEPDSDDEHKVHQIFPVTCPQPPNLEHQITLGEHEGCSGAIAEAKRIYPHKVIDGCPFCCPLCHTQEPTSSASALK